jgi:hypothetical protein
VKVRQEHGLSTNGSVTRERILLTSLVVSERVVFFIERGGIGKLSMATRAQVAGAGRVVDGVSLHIANLFRVRGIIGRPVDLEGSGLQRVRCSLVDRVLIRWCRIGRVVAILGRTINGRVNDIGGAGWRFATGHVGGRVDKAANGNEQPDEKKGGGDEGLGSNAAENLFDDIVDRFSDFVPSFTVRVGKQISGRA